MPRVDSAHILVVEDSITQAEKLTFILQECGHSTSHALSAGAALDFLKDNEPDLIISDVLMPEMNGFEFCNLVKHNNRFSYMPVMLLTALSDPQDIIRGLECGADNFITKPYKREYLVSQLNYMLANARLRQMSRHKHSEIPDMGMEIYFASKKHYIMSSQLQILDLLFSTFEVFVQKNSELIEMNRRLAEKNDRIKSLSGLIPICANCKNIRDDQGYWQQVDYFLSEHSDAGFNHSICPECTAKSDQEKKATEKAPESV